MLLDQMKASSEIATQDLRLKPKEWISGIKMRGMTPVEIMAVHLLIIVTEFTREDN
jgi:hypothetical protein